MKSPKGDSTLYKVYFYKDKNGNSPIIKYMRELAASSDKDSRIKLKKIQEYINYLKAEGKQAGEPYIKPLVGEIWELRPIKDRVLFAAWDGKSFMLFHHFVKKTQKTPQREIEQAKRNLADIRKRGLEDEQ